MGDTYHSRDSLVDKRALRFVIITCNYLGTWHAISYQSPQLHVHVRGPMCPTLQLPISVVVPLQISKRRTALHELLVERRAGRKCDSLALPMPMLCGLNRGWKCKAPICMFCTQVKTRVGSRVFLNVIIVLSPNHLRTLTRSFRAARRRAQTLIPNKIHPPCYLGSSPWPASTEPIRYYRSVSPAPRPGSGSS